ncbi:MAG: radical SAM protein [Myxococcota bacterium]
MNPSRHNILTRLHDRDEHLVVNLLSGHADLLSETEAAGLGGGASASPELVGHGYVVDAEQETKVYRQRYLEALAARERDEVQIFFAPTYACNFACDYCFQNEYGAPKQPVTSEVITAFFAYVDGHFAERRKYVTLFGGEPLLATPHARAAIEQVVTGLAARGIDLSVVTNGYHLVDYLDVLARARVREIQVTLDGVGAVHDARRPLRGGGATFERVVAAIDAALLRELPVNLRVVVDRDNLGGLPDLARLCIDKGWTGNALFKTQLGRNYELHTCQAESSRLFSRSDLHRALYDLYRAHPHLWAFHRPAFSVSRQLVETGELPEPLFDACPGCKTEWAFDYTGKIYPCTAMVGKPGEDVGTYYPHVTLREDRVAAWQDRDVLAIDACKSCPVQLACGGGCAAVAHHRTGKLDAPDCRPVAELLGLGVSLYRQRQEETSS